MNVEKFTTFGKEITLYIAEKKDCPLIVLSSFEGDGLDVLEAAGRLSSDEFSLLNVSKLDWNFDMTPWQVEPFSWEKEELSGGADDYLHLLSDEIIPRAKKLLDGPPDKLGIAGYSLGGLFAIYSLYRSEIFDLAASISGSLWFPGFREFVFENEMMSKPKKIYISLGDKEDKSRNRILRTVRENSESIAAHFVELGIDTKWQLNNGNHFTEPELRTARGISYIVSKMMQG